MCIRDRIILEASGLTNEIDARPSDAIALAVRTFAPIYVNEIVMSCLLYTSDAADERSSVDLGGRRIIKKKKSEDLWGGGSTTTISEYEWRRKMHVK